MAMADFSIKIKKAIHFLNQSDGSLKSKVIRSGFWVGLSTSLLSFLSIGRNIILARLLAPEIFGLMAICLIVIRGVELFTETGFGAALIHRQDQFDEAKETAFTLMVIRGFVLALIVFSISTFVATYYERTELSNPIKAIALVLLFKGFQNINLITQEKNLDFKKLTFLRQATTILDFSIVVILAYFLRSVWALILGQVIVSIIGTVLSYVFIPGRIKFHFDKKIAKSLFAYGKYITGLTIVLFTASGIDNAFIGKILGMEMLGYYVIAYSLANLPATHISKVASRVMFPAYSKLQNNFPALREAYLAVVKLLSTLTIPAAVGLAILAPEIIGLIYGEKWLPAVGSLQILCLFGGCRSILAINGYLYNAVGKPYISFYLGTFRLLLILIGIYPLTKAYGLIGASLSVTVPVILQLILSTIIISNVLKLQPYEIIKILASSLACTAIMGIIVISIKYKVAIDNLFALFSMIVLAMMIHALVNFNYIKSSINKITKAL